MRLIDADALYERIGSYASYAGAFTDELGLVVGLQAVFDGIEYAPTIEAEPVKHGRYITDSLGDSSCSACGEKYLNATHNYCPNCGAKMTEDEA